MKAEISYKNLWSLDYQWRKTRTVFESTLNFAQFEPKIFLLQVKGQEISIFEKKLKYLLENLWSSHK